MPIPTPFAVGRVNCYLIDDDPLTLVDTGPNSGTSLTELEAGLAVHGRRVEDLERIVLTHQHIDHIGLAQILADRSGAEVCALDAAGAAASRTSARRRTRDDEFAEAMMLRHGIPRDVVIALRAVTQQFRGWGASVRGRPAVWPTATCSSSRARAWRVHHRPGHSPSDTVFHDEASGELLGRRPPDQAHLLQPADQPAAGGRHRRAAAAGAADLHRVAARHARDGPRGSCSPATATRSSDHRAADRRAPRLHERRARKIARAARRAAR